MNVKDFVNRYIGVRNVGNTPENKGECVGLVAVYVDELKLSHIWGHAKDLYDNAPVKEWDKFLNTPWGVPKEGDVLIWGATSYNPYGHTAIFLNGNVLSFNSFDQNYPVGSVPHVQYHNYFGGFKGWIRPKTECDTKVTQIKSILNANLENCTKIQNIRAVLA